jgi:cellulose synthase/poly-beta-1,6-N-acetylglucosamine synthase-like glycosyltransferase
LLYLIFILLFILAVLIQCGYAFLFFRGLKNTTAGNDSQEQKVSVVICARNEALNLQQFLPAVLEQDYPQTLFEVIVVNDASIDNSEAVLQALSERYLQLHVVTIATSEPRTLPGKKFALQRGIAAAAHELVLLTDADCRPASPNWLRTMVAQAPANSKTVLVLGYGAYETKPGLLNRFIHWETAHTCMQYAAYAVAGKTYMGVGRNMLYSKNLPELAMTDTIFRDIYRATPSGDDDLLVSAIAKHTQTTVCLSKEAHTVSMAQDTWTKWWKQKTRHASTGKYYRKAVRNLLGLYGLSHSFYWFGGLLLLLTGGIGTTAVMVWALFLLRLCIYWMLAGKWYSMLNEKKLLLFYPLGDLGWAWYNVFLSPFIFWKNKQTWK